MSSAERTQQQDKEKAQAEKTNMKSPHRFYAFSAILSAAFFVSPINSVIGTTLPGLQKHFQVDLGTVSNLLLLPGLGGLSSALVTPILLKYADVYLLLAALTFTFGLGMSSLAATSYIQVGCVGSFIAGLANLGVMTCAFHSGSVLFDGNASVFHILKLFSTLGSIAATVVAEPFIPGPTDCNGTLSEVQVNRTIQQERDLNFSMNNTTVGNHTMRTGNTLYHERPTGSLTTLYIILGVVVLPCTISFIVLFISSKILPDLKIVPPASKYRRLSHKKTWREYVFVISLVVILSITGGIPYTQGIFFTTIAVHGPLYFTISEAVTLTSVFWFLYLVGRFASSAASKLVSQTALVYCCMGFVILALLELTFSINQSLSVFFWVGNLVVAFFAGPIGPGLMSWCICYTEISPHVIGAMLMADIGGTTLFVFIAGQILDNYSNIYYKLFTLGLSVSQFILFGCSHLFGKQMLS